MDQESFTLHHLLKTEEEGKIHFHASRVILMNTSALGLLRQDLITALGHERAKGFLMRYGWHCGSRDASFLKKRYDVNRGLDWLVMGPRMHSLMGVAKVEVKKAEWEPGEHDQHFYMEGYWYHSYEAEQHLQTFGPHHDPVCFTLIGYASGYVSEFTQLPILFREIQCEASGASYCHWIGRKVDEWDPIAQKDLGYLAEKRFGDELEQAYRRIEEQNDALKLAMKVHQQLSRVLTQGGDLQQIIQTLHELVGYPVLIEDDQFHVLALAGVTKEKAEILGRTMAGVWRKKPPTLQKELDMLQGRKQTVRLTVPAGYGYSHTRIMTPILLGNHVFGYLSFLTAEGAEREILCIERAAHSCALYILNRRTAIEIEERLKEELFDSLLHMQEDSFALKHKAKLLGYDLAGAFCIVLIEQIKKEPNPAKDQPLLTWEAQSMMIESLQKMFAAKNIKSLITQKSGRLAAIIPQAFFAGNEDPKKQVAEMISRLSRQFGKPLKAAISSFAQEIKELKRCYAEANKVLQVQSIQQTLLPVASFSDLGVLGIVIQTENPEGMLRFVNQWIGELLSYDEKHHTELTRTLFFYLENNANLYKTSCALNLSLGGLRYRMRRITDIIRHDLANAAIRFEIHLALKILHLLQPESLFSSVREGD